MSDQKCEDLIDSRLEGRLTYMKSVNAVIAGDLEVVTDDELAYAADEDVNRDELNTSYALDNFIDLVSERKDTWPLSIEVKRVVKVLLSWGGPSDFFECHVDEGGDIQRIEYVYQDWFDGARRTLTGSDFDAAAEFLDAFVESALLSQDK